MKLANALKKGKYVSSEKLKAVRQDYESLIYWLIQDKDTNDEEKVKTLKRFLEASDWQADNEV